MSRIMSRHKVIASDFPLINTPQNPRTSRHYCRINATSTAGHCRFKDSMNWNPARPETKQVTPKKDGKYWGVNTAARATSSMDFSPRRMAKLVPWTEWNIRMALVNVAMMMMMMILQRNEKDRDVALQNMKATTPLDHYEEKHQKLWRWS